MVEALANYCAPQAGSHCTDSVVLTRGGQSPGGLRLDLQSLRSFWQTPRKTVKNLCLQSDPVSRTLNDCMTEVVPGRAEHSEHEHHQSEAAHSQDCLQTWTFQG